MTHKVYWGPLLIFAGCYLCIFSVIAVAYYITIIPVVMAWACFTAGPLGVVLGHIQWILQTNALTTLVCQNIVLTHISSQVFDITLYNNGQEEFLRKAKYIRVDKNVSLTKYESWKVKLPLLIVNLLRKAITLLILTLISLIPLLGPLLTNQLVSARRAFSYMARYFTLSGQKAEEAKDFQYGHLALFFTFGMAAGLLEFVPLLSIITILSNTIGAAQWSTNMIKSPKQNK